MGLRNRKPQKMPVKSDSSDGDEYSTKEPAKVCGDFPNIFLLIFLYILQGIPLGLAASVPYLLQSNTKTASYDAQGTFSLTFWPFSIKLAWAPLVDAIYSSRIGRRKTWLIPVQIAIGIDLLVLASYVDDWLGREPGNPWSPLGIAHPVQITQLTVAFFGLTFLAATQDIVVDGWALTMLSKKNVGWASTCNTVGQTFGYVISFMMFLCLESPEISNTYLRSIPVEGRGLITFSGFLYFWGIIFLISTTLIAFLKHEENSVLSQPAQEACHRVMQTATAQQWQTRLQSLRHRTNHQQASSSNHLVDDQLDLTNTAGRNHLDTADLRNFPSPDTNSVLDNSTSHIIDIQEETTKSNDELSLFDTYRVMLGIICLKPVVQYIFMLFVLRMCSAAADTITTLKVIEAGMPKERVALISLFLLPVQAVLPLLITRWSNGPRPLGLYTWAILPKLLMASLAIPLVHYTPYFRTSKAVNQTMQHATNSSNRTQFLGSGNSNMYSFTWSYYGILIAYIVTYAIINNIMAVCQMAFHAKISDASVGGTYMTLLNTASNAASSIPGTVFLYLVEPLTSRQCLDPIPYDAGVAAFRAAHTTNDSVANLPPNSDLLRLGERWIRLNATCQPPLGAAACSAAKGTCRTIVDGFYLEVSIGLTLGFIFYFFIRPLTKRLDALPKWAYSYRLPRHSCCPKLFPNPQTNVQS